MSGNKLIELIVQYGDLRASSELWKTHAIATPDKNGKRELMASAKRCERKSITLLRRLEKQLEKREDTK